MNNPESNDDTEELSAAYDALDEFTRDWVGSERNQRSLLNITRSEQTKFHRVRDLLAAEPSMQAELLELEREHEVTLHLLWSLAPRAEGISASAILLFFSPELDSVVNTVVLDYDALRRVSLS
jgi:hypothetical protein